MPVITCLALFDAVNFAWLIVVHVNRLPVKCCLRHIFKHLKEYNLKLFIIASDRCMEVILADVVHFKYFLFVAAITIQKPQNL